MTPAVLEIMGKSLTGWAVSLMIYHCGHDGTPPSLYMYATTLKSEMNAIRASWRTRITSFESNRIGCCIAIVDSSNSTIFACHLIASASYGYANVHDSVGV